ncbi:hypothetical protein H1Q63_30570 [Desmonostoc muscorum CCALA 125]|nr:hypothetical protein [Desmonostoc muscorum CCALA 125]
MKKNSEVRSQKSEFRIQNSELINGGLEPTTNCFAPSHRFGVVFHRLFISQS